MNDYKIILRNIITKYGTEVTKSFIKGTYTIIPFIIAKNGEDSIKRINLHF